jgi:MFS family permease
MFGAQRVGMLMGPLIGGFAGAAWGPAIPFVIHGVVLLLAVIPSFILVRETIPDAMPKRERAGEPGTFRMLLKYPIPIVFLVQMLANTARGGIEGGGILFLYAAYAYNAGPATLGVLGSIMAGVGIPITLMAGKIMDSKGRKAIIVLGSLFVGAAMVFMSATSFGSLPFSAFVAGFVALHLGGASMSGSMQTLGTDIAPAHARGVFFGVGRLVGQTGRLASPTTFGLLAELASFGAAFVFLATMSVASGIVMALLVKETLGTGAADKEKAEAAESKPSS